MFEIGRKSKQSPRGIWLFGLGMALLMVAGFQGVGAQEKAPSADEEADHTVQGQVVDANTGVPLIGAFIHMDGDEWGTLSGSDGRFELAKVSLGDHSLVVEQLGYQTLKQEVAVEKDQDELVLKVESDPTLLDGINLVLDRFEQRRHSVVTTSRVFNREDLVTDLGVDALGFLKARAPIDVFPCFMGDECAVVHGRLARMRVWVDEMPFSGGIDYLRSRRPYDLQRIEVYDRGRQIRIYTAGFLERAGRTLLNPIPITI